MLFGAILCRFSGGTRRIDRHIYERAVAPIHRDGERPIRRDAVNALSLACVIDAPVTRYGKYRRFLDAVAAK